MKLFSLKKDNDSIAPTSEDANPSSQLAENPMIGVSDNPLQLDTTQAPMQATKSPDTSPNTTAIKNAFSLDSIDLNQLEDELLHGKTDYTADNTKAADTVAPKKLSFDDFDLDELPSDVEPNTTVTLQDTANTATVSQPVPSQTTDNALIFDIDNLPLAAKPDPDLKLSLESDRHSAQPQPISPQSSDENSDKKIIEAIETIETIEMTPPVVLTKTKPESKAIIAQTANPFLRPPSQPLAKRTLKKRNQLGLLVGAGLALAALVWFFMGQSSEPNNSTAQSQTQTQAHSTPKTTAPIVVKPQASASLPVASTVAVDATTSSVHETAALPTITPEEILTPTLPEDPAIAKEELSRLSEQSAQLKEQEAMMQDQLRMMNELSSKKEERIQLLEQQVAQLEQQKAANK